MGAFSHIPLQLMEREVRKLKSAVEPRPVSKTGLRSLRRPRMAAEASEGLEIAQKLEQFLAVAKGEIHRLDYIVTQFLQAIRPSPPQLRPTSLNEVVLETLELLQPELDNRGLEVKTRLARQLPSTPKLIQSKYNRSWSTSQKTPCRL